MPKVKDAKTGKFYTSHWQTNPKRYLKETCLQCHSQWNETQAKYVIESLAAHYQGKVRNASSGWRSSSASSSRRRSSAWRGRAQGRAREARRRARELEWWTAANGASFHNPDLAKASLATSVTASQEGIKILDDAIKAKTGAVAAAPAAK